MINVANDIVSSLGDIYPDAKALYILLGSIVGLLTIHATVYRVIGLFFTRKFKPAKNYHKYAVVIAARNEEQVIGNLLDSIEKQDYPKELIKVFVVADNCTDKTAEIVRSKGVKCYERFNDTDKTKGFALQYLFERIESDYGRMTFDGYMVFDADNLLKEDYISRMNDSFDEGCKIVTSYRNTKNFGESWIASTYALHWLRSIRHNHRTRSFFHLATNIQGTGFLFSSEIVKDGWKYTSLTEDRALTADCVVNGYEISYNDKAVFYDEQPVDLRVACRQRIRWAKGHIMAFNDSGWDLFKNIFFANPPREKGEKSFLTYLLDCIRFRWISFDTFAQLVPINIFNIVRWIFMYLIIYPCFCYCWGMDTIGMLYKGSYLAKITSSIFDYNVSNIGPGVEAYFMCILLVIWFRLCFRICRYFENIPIAVYLFFIERKRIIKMSIWKKILYCFTWPVFDIMGRYAQYAALFMKVTWKPIPHESKIKIEDLTYKVKEQTP